MKTELAGQRPISDQSSSGGSDLLQSLGARVDRALQLNKDSQNSVDSKMVNNFISQFQPVPGMNQNSIV